MQANSQGRAARRLALGGLAAAGLVLAGSAWSQAAQDHVVVITGMNYGRLPDVKVGDTITWQNKDTVAHSVTAKDKSFDLRLPPGKSARMTADKAGAIQIICMYHPMMRGVLKVAPR